jgi:hypothetical protein
VSEDVTTGTDGAAGGVDVGEYCRSIEDHLTRINGGHLVRVVGPGFDLVRGWAESGVPLSVVYRGIELKADRARARRSSPGRAPRPLRIEFCEADVIDLFESWRRAVGVPAATGAIEATGHDGQPAPKRAPSLTKHLDRVIDRLGRVAGRTDLPPSLVESLTMLLEAVSSLREEAKGTRRGLDALKDRLAPLDAQMMTAVRSAAPPELLDDLTREAAQDLAPFQPRLSPEAWRQALELTIDRLLRDRFGLPTIVMGLERA